MSCDCCFCASDGIVALSLPIRFPAAILLKTSEGMRNALWLETGRVMCREEGSVPKQKSGSSQDFDTISAATKALGVRPHDWCVRGPMGTLIPVIRLVHVDFRRSRKNAARIRKAFQKGNGVCKRSFVAWDAKMLNLYPAAKGHVTGTHHIERDFPMNAEKPPPALDLFGPRGSLEWTESGVRDFLLRRCFHGLNELCLERITPRRRDTGVVSTHGNVEGHPYYWCVFSPVLGASEEEAHRCRFECWVPITLLAQTPAYASMLRDMEAKEKESSIWN